MEEMVGKKSIKMVKIHQISLPLPEAASHRQQNRRGKAEDKLCNSRAKTGNGAPNHHLFGETVQLKSLHILM